jgi:hypothetical protein
MPLGGTILFVVALIVLRSLGEAVGVTLAYLGAGLMVRFRREPPDLLKLVDPGSHRLEPYRRSHATASWIWQLASLLSGVVLIGLGVTLFVVAWKG